MEITRLNDDLNIISKLSDEPNDIEGLSASELKARFDTAGNTIKSYINDSLVPDIVNGVASDIDKVSVEAGNLPAGGTEGQMVVKRSDSDYDWELTTPRMIPPGGMPRQLLQKASGEDFDVRFGEPPALDWRLLTEYLTAGAHVWTAPDLYGDGKPYEIGAFIIGGGGGGAAAQSSPPNDALAVSGGASGYTESISVQVTPGQTYPLAVGVGGAGITAPGQGNNGGSSSFLSVTAFGGGGGKAGAGIALGANGGQGSGTINSSAISAYGVAPSGGMVLAALLTTAQGGYVSPIGNTTPGMSINPFNNSRYLAAGGGAVSSGGQTGANLGAAGRSGSGIGSQQSAGNITAGSATTHGCGGGSATRWASGTITGTTTSGAGAPGAVMIYIRWPVGQDLPEPARFLAMENTTQTLSEDSVSQMLLIYDN